LRFGQGSTKRILLYTSLILSLVIPTVGAQEKTTGAAQATPGMLSLDEILTKLDATLRWDPLSAIGALEVPGHRVVFIAEKYPSEIPGPLRPALFDGTVLMLLQPPRLEQGILWFPAAFADSVAGVFSQAREDERSRYRVAAVLIDPGHGGKDPGATGSHLIGGKRIELVEKELVLDVALDLHRKLAAIYPDKRVLLTRDGDTYPSLEDRVALANSVKLAENEAIVFVSIHANASFNKKARGYEVWYLSPEYRRTVIDAERYADSSDVLPILNAMLEEEFTMESIMIAKHIMNGFDRLIGSRSPSRGIKAEEWFVVRKARMPSVLIELGFVTNQDDAVLLSDKSYLRNLSDAIYSGIKDFVTEFEKSGGFTASR
jgi:N-acetylmuramoyl-L-alanine amidase